MKTVIAMLREPLVQFLVIGAMLFLGFHFWGGDTGSHRIVITPGQINAMATRFARTWQRPPTNQELKGLIDDHVQEEMATREAMAMGLDKDDTIIRRRLRQKLEFIAEDAFSAVPPTDGELQAWLDSHPDRFRIESRASFRQVYLNADQRGEAIHSDAQKLLDTLSEARSGVDISAMGDALMLPQQMPLAARSEIASLFGTQFTDTIFDLPQGRWSGPVQSGFGLHVVYVAERVEARTPDLTEVRPMVMREVLNERRKRELAAMYDRLLERYQVSIAPRLEESGTAGAAVKTFRGDAP